MDIFDIQEKLDYNSIFEPDNLEIEKRKFFRSKTGYNPKFTYRDWPGKRHFENIIDKLSKYRTTDVRKKAFIDVYKQVARIFIARSEEDYIKYTKLNGRLFGSYDSLNLEAAIEFCTHIKRPFILRNSPVKLKKRTIETFKQLGLDDWKVDLDETAPNEVSIYDWDKLMVINPIYKYTKYDIDATIFHEIYGHALQSLNAFKSRKYKLFYTSTLGTEQQYEGLALYTEINNMPKVYILTLIQRYLLLMIANSIAAKSDFRTVYEQIYSLARDKDFAFMAALSSKWGFTDTTKLGTFQSYNAYLLGALKVIKLVKKNQNNYLKISSGGFPLEMLSHVRKPSVKELKLGVTKVNNANIQLFTKLLDGVVKVK